jgi:hypothetical protein
MFTVYLWIDGPDFDPDRFQRELPESLRGVVESRKRMHNGKVEAAGKYWKSVSRKVSDEDPIEGLSDCLQQYRDSLLNARKQGATRVVAEIVAQFGSLDEARGLYLSDEAIQLLAECRTSLDVDVVRRLQ